MIIVNPHYYELDDMHKETRRRFLAVAKQQEEENAQTEALSKEQTSSFKTIYFAAIFDYFYGRYNTLKTKILPKITAIDHW